MGLKEIIDDIKKNHSRYQESLEKILSSDTVSDQQKKDAKELSGKARIVKLEELVQVAEQKLNKGP